MFGEDIALVFAICLASRYSEASYLVAFRTLSRPLLCELPILPIWAAMGFVLGHPLTSLH
jgi:hypothetical protein